VTISTINDIVSGISQSQGINVLKNITVPKAIGSYQSSWLGVGFPGAGSSPPLYTAGTGYNCLNTTSGALPYVNPINQNWLAKAAVTSTIAGTLFIYDRLWACTGMPFGAATYTVTTPGSLPARITDNGLGTELWCENTIAAGAATGTLTASYYDANGTLSSAVINPVVSAPLIGQAQPFPLAVGATGVKSLVSLTNSATWTSGSFGAIICKQIASIPVSLAGIGTVLDWASLGLPQIAASACLFFIWQGGAATANQVMANFDIIDK
jgi:hypothetical protein